jgi:hypothetical protein
MQSLVRLVQNYVLYSRFSTLLWNMPLGRPRRNQEGLKLSETAHQLLGCVLMFIYWAETNTIQESTGALLVTSKNVGLKVNTEKIKHVLLFHQGMQYRSWMRHCSTSRRFNSQWGRWIFQVTWSFQPHCDPGVNSACNRNDYQEFSWG